MSNVDPAEEATLFPKTAGEKLREARESEGLSLAEVAARTRVPTRHLEAIERSDYSGLPSPTYSIGFAKAYARAVGLDEVAIGRSVRGQADASHRPSDYVPYEMQDPKRLPPKGLATVVAVLAAVIVIGLGLYYGTGWFQGEGGGTPVAAVAGGAPAASQPVPEPTAAPAASGGQVTLTATDVVWLRVYDATGKSLFEKELQPGERFDVPGDADRPMINVGRPDKLVVTVNGSTVPPLGDGVRAIKDVEISAQALLARGTTDERAAPVADPTPGATEGRSSSDRASSDRSSSDRQSGERGSSGRSSNRRSSDAAPAERPSRGNDQDETARANAAQASSQPASAAPTPEPPPNP